MGIKPFRTGLASTSSFTVVTADEVLRDLRAEVLSPTTEDLDRERKCWHYRTLSSISNYLLVAQTRIQVEHYTRQSTDVWVLREFTYPQDQSHAAI